VDRPLAELSDPATAFARSRPPIVGVAVVVPGSGAIYTQNADEQVPTACVVKVLVMLVVLERARLERRPVTDGELALLWPMVTESDNDSTSQLWEDIGRGQAVASYLRVVGVTGFTPDPGTSWGVSFASARAMATVLGKLLNAEILDEPSRALAFRLLDGVIPQQRWGVTAGTDATAGDAVGLKNGWYPGEEGWRVNSVGIVRPKGRTSYAIAVMTAARESWREGIATIEGVAERVNAARGTRP
jgi:beta-lactamase class A